MGRPQEYGHGILSAVSDMAEGLGRLFTESLELAKVELRADARAIGADFARVAAFGVLALVGYGLAAMAAALALGSALGHIAWGFLIVGGLHLAGGASGALLSLSRLRRRPEHLLEGSRAEAQETGRELREIAAGEVPAPARLAAPHDPAPASPGPGE